MTVRGGGSQQKQDRSLPAEKRLIMGGRWRSDHAIRSEGRGTGSELERWAECKPQGTGRWEESGGAQHSEKSKVGQASHGTRIGNAVQAGASKGRGVRLELERMRKRVGVKTERGCAVEGVV